jgi:uncharacterized protein YjbJ (UPF0337 family)
MGDAHDDAHDGAGDEEIERPATWENIVVGELKEALGRATGDKSVAEAGEEQVEIAHEVREEFREEHDH